MTSPAFCPSLFLARPSSITRLGRCRLRRAPIVYACATQSPADVPSGKTTTASPSGTSSSDTPDTSFSSFSSVPSASVDAEPLPDTLPSTDSASATAQALLDDVTANPQYYLNVSGVLLGLSLLFIVLSATVVALDSIPIVPDVLRVVGLVYLFWFLGKFLFSAPDRERLGNEVDEFVTGVRGGEFRVIGEMGSEKPKAELSDGQES